MRICIIITSSLYNQIDVLLWNNTQLAADNRAPEVKAALEKIPGIQVILHAPGMPYKWSHHQKLVFVWCLEVLIFCRLQLMTQLHFLVDLICVWLGILV